MTREQAKALTLPRLAKLDLLEAYELCCNRHFCVMLAMTYWELNGKPVSSREADYGGSLALCSGRLRLPAVFAENTTDDTRESKATDSAEVGIS